MNRKQRKAKKAKAVNHQKESHGYFKTRVKRRKQPKKPKDR